MLDFLKKNYLVVLAILLVLIGVITWYKYPKAKALKRAKGSKSSSSSKTSSASKSSSSSK